MHKITKYYHSSLHVCVHRLSLLRDANASSAAINILKSIDYLQYLPCEQSFGFAWRRAAGRPAVLGRRSAVAVVASGGTECRARHIFRTVERAISFVSYLSSFRARHIFEFPPYLSSAPDDITRGCTLCITRGRAVHHLLPSASSTANKQNTTPTLHSTTIT